MNKYDVIIVGAGLGGLSAGAYLSKAGLKVLILEQSLYIGGACGIRDIEGYKFDVGANYFGNRILKTFKELGCDTLKILPIKAQGTIKNLTVTHSFGGYSAKEFMALGMTKRKIALTILRFAKQFAVGNSSKTRSFLDVVNEVAKNENLRDFFNIEAFLLGSLPELMPAYMFNVIMGTYYGCHKPFYPAGGSQIIPDTFSEIIQNNRGNIRLSSPVSEIVVKDRTAVAVRTNSGIIESKHVVSAIGVKGTIPLIKDTTIFSQEYIREISKYKRGLELTGIFVVLKKDAPIRKGFHTIVVSAGDIGQELKGLFCGKFPANPIFCFTCADALNPSEPLNSDAYSATIRFFVPSSGVEENLILKESERVLETADRIMPGIRKNLIWKKVVTPRNYYTEIGFSSCASPVLESNEYSKHPSSFPIRNLYCAGATIGAKGCHTGSAVESGKQCAVSILKEWGGIRGD